MQTVTLDEAAIAHDLRVIHYFYLAGIVLLIYDNLLMLDLEVRFIWKSWRSRTSAWYLFIRYSSLCIRTMVLVSFDFGHFNLEVRVNTLHLEITHIFPKDVGLVLSISRNLTRSRNRCNKLNTVKGLLTVLQEGIVGCTLILRVLALYSFERRIVIILVAAVIIFISLAAAMPTGLSHTLNLPPSGCITPYSSAEQVREAGAWEAMLAGDVLLLGLTLYRVYTHEREIPTGRIWRVLIRDGTIIICLANLANILMFHFGDSLTFSSLTGFTVSLSVAVLCRLMLNLHLAAALNTGTTGLGTNSLRFAHTEEGADNGLDPT
ncbi:hypothetical protein MSAN_01816200 [Mycena sanguinolenta]|uniref:DUF6533 domain-containing protein n=1 Tax=Mycena sanguinolenta TaxID=230812 RepID=A0A8H6XUT0_9AGAR|nr:hypothetical protein MSAN_01816200 [Mycena sanguinolenta]